MNPDAARECPVYPEDMKQIVYLGLKKERLVCDVYIGQEGCDLKLALVVDTATNETYAKDLRDRFVRLTKTFGPSAAPSKRIGKGIYNFMVGVFTLAEKRLVMGAKVSFGKVPDMVRIAPCLENGAVVAVARRDRCFLSDFPRTRSSTPKQPTVSGDRSPTRCSAVRILLFTLSPLAGTGHPCTR